MTAWLVAGLVVLGLLWLVTDYRLRRLRRGQYRLLLDLRLERERAADAGREAALLRAINLSFVDQAPSAMLLVNAERKVVHFNPAAAKLFRLALAWGEGKPLIEVVRDHDLDGMVRRALGGASQAVLEVRPPGTDLILQATARPIADVDGKPLGATVVIDDLSELHRLEAVRREFVANVSHELRTPLAGAKALVETLQAGAMEERDLAADFLNKINAELDRLAALVRDLLELSRIESGRVSLNLAPTDLGEVADRLVEGFRGAADRAGLVLECRVNAKLRVLADEARTEQVLTNLLENAVKFTPHGGEIHVSADDGGGQATVTVSDTGIGIPEEDLPRVFERFYKVDKARTRAESSGTGLGLAISKHLVQAMGGRIWAESAPGQGSRFRFTLPLAASAGPDGHDPARDDAAALSR